MAVGALRMKTVDKSRKIDAAKLELHDIIIQEAQLSLRDRAMCCVSSQLDDLCDNKL